MKNGGRRARGRAKAGCKARGIEVAMLNRENLFSAIARIAFVSLAASFTAHPSYPHIAFGWHTQAALSLRRRQLARRRRGAVRVGLRRAAAAAGAALRSFTCGYRACLAAGRRGQPSLLFSSRT
eukprot:6204196-Pleurochrysis_carterae.AAC.1